MGSLEELRLNRDMASQEVIVHEKLLFVRRNVSQDTVKFNVPWHSYGIITYFLLIDSS